ncbi:MAG TPA: NAD(P)-dependent oxidoreductase [Actinospica sp.]|jgi:nucleoside-diphosphate-sugar epimerase|nr:NAD(P)-dependent oxidoreductase [Actinospica sp.]
MRVFVAGATGVLGTAAVRNLVAGGHKVTGVARSQPKRDALAAAGATPVAADLFDPVGLRHAVAGHDVVVNLATSIPPGTAALRAKNWRENDRIRTEASRNLADAAAAEGVLRLVQEAVSFVYEDGGEDWITEHHPVRPNAVTASSITATEHAMDFADAYRFAVVLRFGLLYGDEPATRWQLDRVRKGKPVVMGDPAGYLSPITVQDAAGAVVASLAAPSGVYNVSGAPLTRAEWAEALGKAAGVGGPARYLSPLALRLVAKRAEPFLRSQRISSDAFHNATGWRARTTVADGLSGVSVS